MEKKTTSKTTAGGSLEDLADRLAGTEAKIRKLEEDNAKVFAKHRELCDLKEGLVDKIKQKAREMAPGDGVRTLIESPDIRITVVQKHTTKWDYAKAKKFWSDELLSQATIASIDGKIVERLLEKGQVTEAEVAKVRERVAMTPAVSVDLP